MSERSQITRRRFIHAGSAAAAGAVLLDADTAPAAERPNVLLIVVDTLRADYVSSYGGRARTPNIDALARRGIRFSRFYPEAMATVPARRSIMTGRRVFPFRGWHRWPSLLRTPGWAPIEDVDATFTSALRRAGYWTGYFTDNPFLGFSAPYRTFRRSFSRFDRVVGQVWTDAPPSSISDAQLRGWLVPELRKPHIEKRMRRFMAAGRYWRDEPHSWAARVFGGAAQALDEAAAHQPFAMVVDTFEPHEPWTPPRRYIDMYGDRDYRGPEPGMARYKRVSEWLRPSRRGPVLSRMRDLYAAEVTMTDRWLGVLLRRLRELRLERNTVIALVSDHGFLLGEYGYTGKIAAQLHPALIHVPLILVDPARRRAGRTSDYFAQTHDIGPTLLAMAGVRRPRGMDGVDLSPVFRGREPQERRMAYGGYANWCFARTDRWKLISENRGRARRLYDVRRDPRENRNIAASNRDKVEELWDALVRRTGGEPPVYRSKR